MNSWTESSNLELINQVEVLTTSTALTYCHIVLESHCPQSCCYQVDWKWKSSISEILNFIMENKLQMYCCYKLIHVLNQSRGNTYRTVKFGIIENSGGRIPVKLLLSNRLQKIPLCSHFVNTYNDNQQMLQYECNVRLTNALVLAFGKVVEVLDR